jgi:hypothetical protein
MPENSTNVHEMRTFWESHWKPSYAHFPRVIREHKLEAGVEVGVGFGGHAEAILEQTEVTELVGVDPYEHRAGYDDPMNLPPEQFEHLFWYVMGRLSRFGPRYTHLRGTSQQAANVLNVEIDFAYLDGDHSYEGVRQDLSLWYPKVRAAGIIGGHDYGNRDFPGVGRAVDEFFAPHGSVVRNEGDSVWWVRKNV